MVSRSSLAFEALTDLDFAAAMDSCSLHLPAFQPLKERIAFYKDRLHTLDAAGSVRSFYPSARCNTLIPFLLPARCGHHLHCWSSLLSANGSLLSIPPTSPRDLISVHPFAGAF